MMNRKTGKVSSELKIELWTGVNWSFNAVKSHGNLTANVLWVCRLYGCDSMLVEHLRLPFNADLFMKEKRLSVDKIGCFRLLIGGFGLFMFASEQLLCQDLVESTRRRHPQVFAEEASLEISCIV